MLTKQQNGLIYCITAQTLWGLGVVFWPLLNYLPPITVLCLRLFCSLLFAGLLILYTKQFNNIKAIFKDTKNKSIIRNIFFAATILAINWGCYLYALHTKQAIEASLGYYITPIISILLGRIFFNDILNRYQVIAIILVLIGVTSGIISYGHIPYLGLAIGTTFALYGFFSKLINANAISVLFLETLILSPFCLGWIICTEPQYAILGYHYSHYILLVGTIFFTGIPLMLFSYAATTVSLTTIGFMLYIAPSINFIFAVFYHGEPIKASDYITFPIVWIALAIYSLDMFYKIKNKKV